MYLDECIEIDPDECKWKGVSGRGSVQDEDVKEHKRLIQKHRTRPPGPFPLDLFFSLHQHTFSTPIWKQSGVLSVELFAPGPLALFQKGAIASPASNRAG